MGFKDGTGNPHSDEAPAWMRGGSYMVMRRARMALEHWERSKVAFQEQTFGRRIFETMSRFDMMNQFVTNAGGGHWACPAGAREGDYVGRALLEA